MKPRMSACISRKRTLRPTLVWYPSRKKCNQLQHALNGNMLRKVGGCVHADRPGQRFRQKLFVRCHLRHSSPLSLSVWTSCLPSHCRLSFAVTVLRSQVGRLVSSSTGSSTSRSTRRSSPSAAMPSTSPTFPATTTSTSTPTMQSAPRSSRPSTTTPMKTLRQPDPPAKRRCVARQLPSSSSHLRDPSYGALIPV